MATDLHDRLADLTARTPRRPRLLTGHHSPVSHPAVEDRMALHRALGQSRPDSVR